MKKLFVMSLVAIFMLSNSAFGADNSTPVVKTEAKAKAGEQKAAKGTTGPIQKLERGVGNAAFGWSEIPKRIVDKSKESNPVQGLLVGTFQGVCKAFARTASGVFDVVSFPFSGYDKPVVTPDMPAATK